MIKISSRLFRLSLALAHLIIQATFTAHYHRLQTDAYSSSAQTSLHDSQLSPADCKLCDLNTASTANISADVQFFPNLVAVAFTQPFSISVQKTSPPRGNSARAPPTV